MATVLTPTEIHPISRKARIFESTSISLESPRFSSTFQTYIVGIESGKIESEKLKGKIFFFQIFATINGNFSRNYLFEMFFFHQKRMDGCWRGEEIVPLTHSSLFHQLNRLPASLLWAKKKAFFFCLYCASAFLYQYLFEFL